MELEEQRLVLSAFAANRDLMALCNNIVQPSYFDPSLKKTVQFMKDYFHEYKDVPRAEVIRAKTGIVLETVGEVPRSEQKFIANEVEAFCLHSAMTEAVLQAPELIQKKEFGKVLVVLKDATSVGLVKDLGIDYFMDPEARLKKTLIDEARMSTGWPELDYLLGGGMSRQELLLFAANSGGGKSMTMLNIGKNFLAQGLNGVYISLEMSEGVVSKRLDSMITKIGQDRLLKQMMEASAKITTASKTMGRFIIKRMPENSTTINTIRSYLQQLEQTNGFIPDFIIVDYIDIMGTTMSISMDNLFIKDKYVTEEVRSLGHEFNCMVISASQLGRHAIEAEKLSQAHIQGGISKINTSDYVIAIKQDDVMRASGEIYFECLKARNSAATGMRKQLGWDPISLCINSLEANPTMEFKRKSKLPAAALNTANTFFSHTNPDSGVLGLMNT